MASWRKGAYKPGMVLVKPGPIRRAGPKRRIAPTLVRGALLGAVQRVALGGEAKYVDIASDTYNLDTTGEITHMSIVPQGATVNSRVGRKCELTTFQMRGRVIAGSTGTICDAAAYLVWDEQPNKALAAITDILDAATPNGLSKRENVQRFKIIRKWRWMLVGNQTTPTAGTEAYTVDEYVKLPKGCVVVPTTADTTGVISDVITGALLFVTVGSVAAGTTAGAAVLTARTGFRDA